MNAEIKAKLAEVQDRADNAVPPGTRSLFEAVSDRRFLLALCKTERAKLKKAKEMLREAEGLVLCDVASGCNCGCRKLNADIEAFVGDS